MALPGIVASLGSIFAGVHVVVATVAALAFLAAYWLGPAMRLVILLGVPVVVSATADVASVLSWQAWIWLLIAAGWILSLALWTGLGRIPWVGVLVLVMALVAVFLLLGVPHQSATLYRSDIMTRMQVAVAALALLTAISVGRALQPYLRRS